MVGSICDVVICAAVSIYRFYDEDLLRMTNQMLDVESTDRDLQIYTAKKINRTAQMIENEYIVLTSFVVGHTESTRRRRLLSAQKPQPRSESTAATPYPKGNPRSARSKPSALIVALLLSTICEGNALTR